MAVEIRTPTAWLIRAGRHGEREETALQQGLIIAGWEELDDDLGGCRSKEELRDRVWRTYPDDGKARIANWTGQLWRFLEQIREGDHVVMPLKTHFSRVAVGRVTGPYHYRKDAPEGFRHVRPVEWLQTDIPREAIKQDLLDSMGSLLTVCGLTRNDAARRVAHLAEYRIDPGDGLAMQDNGEIASRSDLLAEAADRDPSAPVRLTIRELLERWDAVRRTPTVVASIEADLAEKGLTTRPAFTEGWLDNVIELVPLGEEPVVGQPSFASQIAEDTQDISELPPVTLRVGDLKAANSGVTSVLPDAPLQNATTTMLLHGYSQLAVIGADGTFYGAVSWESIGEAHVHDPNATLHVATRAAQQVEFDALLLDQINEIYSKGFVFVRSADKTKIGGIVTAADLTLQFGDLVRPFVLIEEIEQRLRRAANQVFTLDEIRSVAKNKKSEKVQSAADLTFGNYPYLLEPQECWEKLTWNVDKQQFIDLLKAVNLIRNELMHFSSDPIATGQLDQLSGLLKLLRTVDPKL